MISKKTTKIDKIFTAEDFINFCGFLRKHKLYHDNLIINEGFFSLFTRALDFPAKTLAM